MSTHSSIARLFAQPDRRDVELAVQSSSPVRLPTLENAAYWQGLFRATNESLFRGQLPDTMVTFTHRRRVLGHFCSCAYDDGAGLVAHEIAMNPDWFAAMGFAETVSTFAHECVHLWRSVFGGRNRRGTFDAPGYHSAVWADKMEAVGLMPSDTGAPGGSRTGYRVSHYILEGGPFDRFCRELQISGIDLLWRTTAPRAHEAPPEGLSIPPSKNTRTRFVCPKGCDEKAWSKASANLLCGCCRRRMVAS